MSTEVLQSILLFIGGVGLFVYGMDVMAEGLQQAAGEKTRRLLEVLTSNRLLGVMVGALITAIIQSSGATTVMVVGFVNAGLMNLSQAVGVIMGANIGTTMTAWIVSMGEWAAFLQPEMLAPVLLGAGVFLTMILRSQRAREASKILIGFGMLFMGLSIMSNAVTPYADAPIFTDIFRVIGGNPILGLLTGALVTAIMQSSSASMGILQTLALTGIVNWGSAVYIALGQNIGTCVVALISAAGGDASAKRAAMIHLEFNVIGSLIVGTAAAVFFLMDPAFMHANVTSTSLAMFHTGFNVVTTILLFPFANQLVKLSGLLVPSAHRQKNPENQLRLDDRFLEVPRVALLAVHREINYMGQLALENIGYSRDALLNNQNFEKLAANEERVNQLNEGISAYLEKLNTATLTVKEQREARHALLALRDISHISDRCQDIASLSQKYIEQKTFTEQNVEDINSLETQCYKAVKYALEVRVDANRELVAKVEKYEARVDNLESLMREGRMESLMDQKTSAVSTIVFLEAVDCYERIADHAKLLAHYVALEEGIAEPALPALQGTH